MKFDVILRVGTKLLLPFLLLFALYVQFHGEVGPGGGFQAGVMSGAMVILYALLYGLDAAKRAAPPRVVEAMVPAGALLYASTGLYTMLAGKNFLDYSALGSYAPKARELGIIIVELGVLITVAGTMIALFYTFGERGSRIE
jgi:multicomponent Na+:H+ antiporter subunit B